MLPSSYRSKQEFLSSLPPWRRLLARLNWHPTLELKVQRYALERRLSELDDEQSAFDARMKSLDAKLDALWPCSNSSTSQLQPPDGDSAMSSP